MKLFDSLCHPFARELDGIDLQRISYLIMDDASVMGKADLSCERLEDTRSRTRVGLLVLEF